jgi:vesicle-associated membrane protein 2
MRVNVEKVLERDQKLSELDDRAGENLRTYLHSFPFLLNFLIIVFIKDALQQGASQFEQQAGKLKRKFWWKNLKVNNFIHISSLGVII